MIIISGADSYRFDAHINHQNFADYRNIPYKFYSDITVDNGVITAPQFTKIYAILDAFKEHDQVMWIDDDAFFINFNFDPNEIFAQSDKPFIVNQGANVKSQHRIFNSGVMFLRRHPDVIKMLEEVLTISEQDKFENWNNDWGSAKGCDQPRLVMLTNTKYQDVIEVLAYEEFPFNRNPRQSLHRLSHVVHFHGPQWKKVNEIEHYVKEKINLYSEKIIAKVHIKRRPIYKWVGGKFRRSNPIAKKFVKED